MQETPLSLHGTASESGSAVAFTATACEAAVSAVAFTTNLATIYTTIAVGLRKGHVSAALNELAMSAGDLDFLLTFLDIVGDCLMGEDDTTRQSVGLYRSRVSGSLDSLHLALNSGDLISLADAIDDDVVEAFKSYSAIDDDVQVALASALEKITKER